MVVAHQRHVSQPDAQILLLLLLYWIRALPDRPVGSQTRLIGIHREETEPDQEPSATHFPS